MQVAVLLDALPRQLELHLRKFSQRGAILPAMQQPTAGAIGTANWVKVDVLTPYQRLTAEMNLPRRMRETLNDPESLFHLRNVSAEPLLPGAVPLNGVPEGIFNKALIGGIRTIEPEPPAADQVMETMRRYCMFQASEFMVTGFAEFAKAASPEMHTEILLKGRFFQLFDATITIIGVPGKSWTQANIWANRDHMVGLFLG
ncbi:MAG TPA: hypothetical protein VFL29_07660 [Candidatus Dormibacteraeota bacterium]|nr:hypothetical protein [Candidatus Dormibacteraeota bacterium]